MKTVYLLRHGKSSWDDPQLDDHDRPLAKRGRKAVPLMGEYMERQRLYPDLILCSGALRTRETLDLILAELGDREIPVQVEEGLYMAGAKDLLERLRTVDDSVPSVMMVGHNPGMQDLALMLAAGDGSDAWLRVRKKFPTAAMAVLTCDDRAWQDLRQHGMRLQALVRPKDLAA